MKEVWIEYLSPAVARCCVFAVTVKSNPISRGSGRFLDSDRRKPRLPVRLQIERIILTGDPAFAILSTYIATDFPSKLPGSL